MDVLQIPAQKKFLAGIFVLMELLPTEFWRSRWLVLPEGDVLHRVGEIEWGALPYEPEPGTALADPDYRREMEANRIEGVGRTVCGVSGFLRVPGIFSRMSLPRCAECCKRVGVPDGKGNPYNEGMDE